MIPIDLLFICLFMKLFSVAFLPPGANQPHCLLVLPISLSPENNDES